MSRTIEDVLAVAGNRPVFEALVSILEAGKAIAFVGAGASAPMYPLWGTFIELLADHAVAEGKAEERDAKRWKADTTSKPQQRVNVILRKRGEPLYRNFLRATFGPTKGPDGRRYTAAHAALLHVPFRAYVTTNYDPALEFARAELRPESLSTGTPTWEDDDEIYRWRTGDVFADDCPMLWIHGYWQRPAGVVLNSGEYSQAYKPGIYRETFKELWVREHLVFLGFGFNDPQFTFMVGEFLRDLGGANAVPRHVAILGLPARIAGVQRVQFKEKPEVWLLDFHPADWFVGVGLIGLSFIVFSIGLVESPPGVRAAEILVAAGLCWTGGLALMDLGAERYGLYDLTPSFAMRVLLVALYLAICVLTFWRTRPR